MADCLSVLTCVKAQCRKVAKLMPIFLECYFNLARCGNPCPDDALGVQVLNPDLFAEATIRQGLAGHLDT